MKEQYLSTIVSIIRAGHRLTDEVSLALKEYEVSEPQFNVLRILRGAKGSPYTVQGISERMIQRSSNVTRIIDKLLKRGFVERKECASNRRKMDILITHEGLQFLKVLDKKVKTFHKAYANNLNEKELNTLNKLVAKLIPNEND